MPLKGDDLKFSIKLEPDDKRMKESLRDLAAQLKKDLADQGMKDALDGFVQQTRHRADAMERITSQMEKQKNLAEMIRTASDPKLLRDQVAQELKILETRQKYARLHKAEMDRQAPEVNNLERRVVKPGQQNFAGMLAQLFSGKRGAMGTIGAFAGGMAGGGAKGGLAGALGAAVGGPGGAGVGAGMAAGGTAAAGAAAGAAGGPVGLAIVAAVAGIEGFKKALSSLVETLTEGARLANPHAFTLLNIAMEDTMAVVGRTVVPLVQMFTQGMRGLGDILANILPNEFEVREAMAGMSKSLGEMITAFKGVATEVGPVIREGLLLAIRELAAAFTIAAKTSALFYTQMRKIIRLLGLGAPDEFQQQRSSAGAAARPTRFMGFEEYAKSIQAAGFMGGGIQDPMNRVADGLARVAGPLELIAKALSNPGAFNLKQAAQQVGSTPLGGALQTMSDPLGIRRAILGW